MHNTKTWQGHKGQSKAEDFVKMHEKEFLNAINALCKQKLLSALLMHFISKMPRPSWIAILPTDWWNSVLIPVNATSFIEVPNFEHLGGGARNLATATLEWLKNILFIRYFVKFPPTRTQNFLRRWGGAVATWPCSRGTTTGIPSWRHW